MENVKINMELRHGPKQKRIDDFTENRAIPDDGYTFCFLVCDFLFFGRSLGMVPKLCGGTCCCVVDRNSGNELDYNKRWTLA